MNNSHDGDASPNPYEHHITGWPPFYNRDDPVLPNFLEDGDPVIATWDGDVRFFPTETIRCASPGDADQSPKLPTYTRTLDYLSTMFRT